jgi:NADPH-dependent curcumin reductase CurA
MSNNPDKQTYVNQKWVLSRRPKGHFDASKDCELKEEIIDPDELQDDEVLIQVTAIGVDAFIRVMLDEVEESHGGANRVHGGISLGDVIPANAIGRVVKSGSKSKLPVGKLVTGLFGGQLYAKAKNPMSVLKIPRVPDHAFLSLFSVSGLTAYVGLNRVVKAPRKGETVVVTAAAGATGSIAAQLAKVRGSRVVGVAGGPEKKAFLLNEMGLDGAIDYKDKTKSLREQFDEQCPDGIDFLYDNVGGDCLNEALHHIAKHGRVVICGAISQYGQAQQQGPSNYIRLAEQSATMSGFVVLHYPISMLTGFLHLLWFFFRGKVRSIEQVHDGGIKDFPKALEGLFQGGNIGKPIIQL